MNIKVREAVIDDYDIVTKIMNQVQQMHVEWRPDVYRPNHDLISIVAFKEAILSNTFYVAEIEEKVVGILGIMFIHIETPSHITRDILFVDSMAVDEPYRGLGVGHAFFDKIKEISRQKKCDGIELQVNAKNKKAYEMYSNYGFTEKSITMEFK
ncbi:MAG: GNAT family N-acetyltransferase [Chloroflexi bacterium]|nr:GNAT family N-acetyltransferase [Chloroflexota bacterium]